MQWAYEGKKLESTVKHLSWVPPWVDVDDPKRCLLYTSAAADE